jgi:hypothetical protein
MNWSTEIEPASGLLVQTSTDGRARLLAPRLRKTWAALIPGPHPKYGVERAFIQGYPSRAKGYPNHVAYDLPKVGAWLEVALAGDRHAYGWNGLTLDHLPDRAWLKVAITGPDPGQPGAWYGHQCECGGEVAGFDNAGFPWCVTHIEVDAVAS